MLFTVGHVNLGHTLRVWGDSGRWLGVQEPGHKILDPESWILGPRARIQDAGSRILELALNPRSWILDAGSWIEYPGSWILAAQPMIVDPGLGLGTWG